MKILREFKEPTNIVITGQWVNSKEPSLSLTDDECSCSIRDYKGDYVSITSFGSITILTEDEFDWFLESDHYRLFCDDDFGRKENMYVAIKNYVGVIGATGLYSGTEEEFDDWDINDYFYHQVEDSGVILNISGKYNIQPMTVDEVSEFLSSNRISKVVKEEPEVSLRERIKMLEERVESQSEQIRLLNDSLSWCEHYIKQ